MSAPTSCDASLAKEESRKGKWDVGDRAALLLNFLVIDVLSLVVSEDLLTRTALLRVRSSRARILPVRISPTGRALTTRAEEPPDDRTHKGQPDNQDGDKQEKDESEETKHSKKTEK